MSVVKAIWRFYSERGYIFVAGFLAAIGAGAIIVGDLLNGVLIEVCVALLLGVAVSEWRRVHANLDRALEIAEEMLRMREKDS